MKKLIILGIIFIILSSNSVLGYGLLSTLSFGVSAELNNNPPTISNPNPANNSVNNVLSLIWNVTIEDPNGDTFNWTIECNNSQTNSSNEESNGSKTLSLSGLLYGTQYTVWVNATDGKESSSEMYYFTTTSFVLLSTLSFGCSVVIRDNTCPSSSEFSIANGTINVVIIPHP